MNKLFLYLYFFYDSSLMLIFVVTLQRNHLVITYL